jgi:hypothetical protein
MRSPSAVRLLLAATLLLGVAGCHNSSEPDPLIGTYLATTLTIQPSGLGVRNALALGGTLGINIANNYETAGTLVLPPAATGGGAILADMAGVADTAGAFVRFVQPADSFVRDLQFTLVENRLEARNQVVAGTAYDVVLTRQ